MASSTSETGNDSSAPQLLPILCLLGVVSLLSSITPAMKYVFQHSALNFLDVACGRVLIGFAFLALVTGYLDWRGLRGLRVSECVPLAAVGLLGVGAYAAAAWGLQYTSATHYALVYSLLPTFTAVFSFFLRNDRTTPLTWLGILISWLGCLLGIANGITVSTIEFGFGDGLALLFTAMMSAHIVLSTRIVRRHGVLVSNTAMFGTSALMLSLGTAAWGAAPQGREVTWDVAAAVLYVGLGTACVFLLRTRALQSLTPATVGAYHNLIPICMIVLAHLFLGEAITSQTLAGGLAVVLGTEMVRKAPYLMPCTLWLNERVNAITLPSLALNRIRVYGRSGRHVDQ